MNPRLRLTLAGEGTSDEALVPIVRWLFQSLRPQAVVDIRFHSPSERQRPLEKQLPVALMLYPCDVLLVHRDAEKEPAETRRNQILAALKTIKDPPRAVCVVPVRMSEAWMLFDEKAIRKAAGNPNGSTPLDLPALSKVETLPNPKEVLNQAILTAAELTPRRRKGFRSSQYAGLITQYIEDFSPLRSLPAFQALEAEIKAL
jgi:hypothetical protein